MRIFDGGNDSDLREAGALLRGGGVAALPTETVYGLAADASNPAAIARVYAIKGRPDNKPLPILMAGEEDAIRLCHVTAAARELMAKYWPGPLTLIMNASAQGSETLCTLPQPGPGGCATVGGRCPDHPAALAVLRYAGVPLALTSANRSGEPPPSSPSQISLIGLGGIVDGGPCAVGRPSAILDVTSDAPQLLRHSAAVVGVTGGSGAGKSAVLERLKALGAAIVRADDIYHKLLASDEGMLGELRERFADAFTKSGAFDRAAMRKIAFSDPAALAGLNRITHPYVVKEARRKMARVFLKDSGTPIAIEAIALIGSGLDALCTVKVAVTAPFLTRAERIMSRDGLASEDAMKRLHGQKDDAYYIKNCDITVENNGTAEELNERVDAIWETRVKS
ncbi:MAG: L-threonylcarbamoyladenylate synthase [Oscillospiraceae bacterium]|nr:L-threonylcarbamoyladenylate synthase [Oscillospiraceae bacterium]